MKFTSRYYETERDLQDMQGLLIEGRLQTDDWHYMHIGEMTFRFFMLFCHLNPQQHVRLWHSAERRLAGYAILGEDPYFDWQVLPAYEWDGIETEAIDWAEAYLIDLRQRDPEQWGGSLVSGARQDNGMRRMFLVQHGFRYSGEFAEVNMIRSLDEQIPSSVLPTGYQVRGIAERGEDAKRAAAHRQVWLPWTDGDIRDEDYAYFMQLPGYYHDLDIVAVTPGGNIAAFVNGWIDPVNRIGELGSVGAVPAYRQQGLTRAVLLQCMRRMKALGMERVCVSTGVSNIPAIRLYQSVGFEIMNQYLDYVKTG